MVASNYFFAVESHKKAKWLQVHAKPLPYNTSNLLHGR